VSGSLAALTREIEACRACPRLVAWRDEAAAKPRRRSASETCWARPVAGLASQPESVRRSDGLALSDADVLGARGGGG
jgi:uracil-DNA glycosylase